MKNRKPREKRASFYDAHFYNILDYFILAVLVAGVLIFILYPLLCMIRQSFVGEEGFSTEVYKSIFSANLQLVKNSVFVGVLSAFFSTILGLLVSICVWTAGKKLGKFLEAILLISMVSPPFIASLAYIQLFGRNGLITKGVFAEPVWMAWCCCNADVILFFIKCTDDYRNAEENGYVARKGIF